MDDDAEDRILPAEAWRSACPGYTVETASNGYQAIHYLRSDLLCLVILDLNMPGVDMITKPISFSLLKQTVSQLLSYCKKIT
jgi:CheY-like chemotaxis protein